MLPNSILIVGADPEKELAPFSDELEVPEYSATCDCQSWRERQAVVKELGSRKDWEGEPLAYQAAEDQLLRTLSIGFSPNCLDCKGTGTVKTTVNPRARFRSYMLGAIASAILLTADGSYTTQAIKEEVYWQQWEGWDIPTPALLINSEWYATLEEEQEWNEFFWKKLKSAKPTETVTVAQLVPL